MKGKLIVIEGCDSSGKETQSNLLVKKLNLMGINSISLSFKTFISFPCFKDYSIFTRNFHKFNKSKCIESFFKINNKL